VAAGRVNELRVAACGLAVSIEVDRDGPTGAHWAAVRAAYEAARAALGDPETDNTDGCHVRPSVLSAGPVPDGEKPEWMRDLEPVNDGNGITNLGKLGGAGG